MRPLILASASPRRKELLGLLGLPFEVVPSAFEEPSPETHPDPAAFAEHLAREKAVDVARRRRGALVLGADTVVALGERLYGKPAGPEDAARMLAELSGRTHRVITGVALAEGEGDADLESFAASTEVTFRRLQPEEIGAYVATGEPLDKAGSYAIQGRGGLLIEGIRGDYPNVVGLPLTPLALRLRARGLRVLGIP
jgi:septum formation protein